VTTDRREPDLPVERRHVFLGLSQQVSPTGPTELVVEAPHATEMGPKPASLSPRL